MSAASESGWPDGSGAVGPVRAGFVAPDVPSDAIVNTCIKCGLCLPTCPTYELKQDERSSPRGRIHLIGAVLAGTLPIDDPTFTAQMSECLGCRNCEPVCPSGVAFGSLLEDARAQIARHHAARPASVVKRLAYDLALGNRMVLRALSAAIAFLDASGTRALVRRTGLLDALGLARLDALVPTPRGRPFEGRDQMWPGDVDDEEVDVALFTGCVMSAMFGDVHRATVRVLARSGFTVAVPAGQGCCGALHLHAGFKDAARAYARRTIAAFEDADGEVIAVNAAGCGAVMKEYGDLLADDPAWARRAAEFAARVRDATELVGGLASAAAHTPTAVPMRVAYQDPCHLAHAQRVTAQPRRAIDALLGVRRVEMEEADRCCGSAGVYNVTHPDIADRLADKKIDAARAAGAQRIVTANPGCQMQLAAASRRVHGPPVLHIMELLDNPASSGEPTIDRRHSIIGGLLLLAGAIVVAGVVVAGLRRMR